jgi:hypothetical protein
VRLEEERTGLQAALEVAEREEGAAHHALEVAHQDKHAKACAPPDESPSQKTVVALHDAGVEESVRASEVAHAEREASAVEEDECLHTQGVEPCVATEQVKCTRAAKKVGSGVLRPRRNVYGYSRCVRIGPRIWYLQVRPVGRGFNPSGPDSCVCGLGNPPGPGCYLYYSVGIGG